VVKLADSKGHIKIGFTKTLNLTSFYQLYNETLGEKLPFDYELIPSSFSNITDLKVTNSSLVDLDDQEFTLYLNYTTPELVSQQKEPDYILVNLTNVVDVLTDNNTDEFQSTIVLFALPLQNPHVSKIVECEESGTIFGNLVKGSFVLSFILLYFIRGAMSELFSAMDFLIIITHL